MAHEPLRDDLLPDQHGGAEGHAEDQRPRQQALPDGWVVGRDGPKDVEHGNREHQGSQHDEIPLADHRQGMDLEHGQRIAHKLAWTRGAEAVRARHGSLVLHGRPARSR